MEAVTNFSLIQKAQIGAPYFNQLLRQSGMNKAELSRLLWVYTITIDNYRRSDKPFDMLKGELLLKLSRLLS